MIWCPCSLRNSVCEIRYLSWIMVSQIPPLIFKNLSRNSGHLLLPAMEHFSPSKAGSTSDDVFVTSTPYPTSGAIVGAGQHGAALDALKTQQSSKKENFLGSMML